MGYYYISVDQFSEKASLAVGFSVTKGRLQVSQLSMQVSYNYFFIPRLLFLDQH